MKKINTYLLLLLCISINAQELSSIWNNVEMIGLTGGVPGPIVALNTNVSPVAFTSPCFNNDVENFALATEYGQGRVMMLGHEGITSDNLSLIHI